MGGPNDAKDRDDESASRLASGGLIIFIGMILQLSIGFLARAFIARELGRFDYGSVSIGRTFLRTATAISLLGLNIGIARNLPRYKTVQEKKGIILTGIKLAVPVALFISLLLALEAHFIASEIFNDPSVAPVIRIFSLSVPFAVTMRLAIGVSQGKEKSLPKTLIENISLPISQLMLITLAILGGGRSVSISWAYFGSYLIAGGISAYYIFDNLPKTSQIEPDMMYKGMLSFSIPLMLVSTMELVFEQSDTYIMWFYTGVETVGVYQAVYPLATLMTVVLVSFRFLTMPILSKYHSDNKTQKMRDIYQTISKWILFGTSPLFFIAVFFPKPAISITFGAEYIEGSQALRVLAVGFLTHAVLGLNGATLTAVGKTRAVFIANAAAAFVNIILNFSLIPRYPLLGAAVATTTSYILLNSIFSGYLYLVSGITPLSDGLLRVTILSGLVMIGSWLALNQLIISPIYLIPVIVVYGLAHTIVIIRYVTISETELLLVAELESKLGEKIDPLKKISTIIRN